MKFAVNYSPQAAALLDAGELDIDLYKCPDWPDLVATARVQRPAYIHFPLTIGINQTWDFAEIERWLATTETLFVNAHYAPRAPFFPAGMDRDGLIEATTRELARLTQHFGKERVILENIPWFYMEIRLNLLPLAVDPAVIRAVIEAVDCGLLLDLSHAALTCENTGGGSLADYIAALPMERLRELHITGIGVHPVEQEREDHLPLQDDDWTRVEWAFRQMAAGAWARPQVVALEYGGIGTSFEWRSETDVIRRDGGRLMGMCRAMAL